MISAFPNSSEVIRIIVKLSRIVKLTRIVKRSILVYKVAACTLYAVGQLKSKELNCPSGIIYYREYYKPLADLYPFIVHEKTLIILTPGKHIL